MNLDKGDLGSRKSPSGTMCLCATGESTINSINFFAALLSPVLDEFDPVY